MKKVTFALLVAALPLLAGCFGKDKEEVKTEAVQTEETTTEETSMHEEAPAAEEAQTDDKE